MLKGAGAMAPLFWHISIWYDQLTVDMLVLELKQKLMRAEVGSLPYLKCRRTLLLSFFPMAHFLGKERVRR